MICMYLYVDPVRYHKLLSDHLWKKVFILPNPCLDKHVHTDVLILLVLDSSRSPRESKEPLLPVLGYLLKSFGHPNRFD